LLARTRQAVTMDLLEAGTEVGTCLGIRHPASHGMCRSFETHSKTIVVCRCMTLH
jgi:hypothetical protein